MVPALGAPARRVKPPIQDILRRGDEVLVQVIKEGIGTKGPTLSTYISIPGRYLVLMPALGRVGVSRKIEDEEVRRKLRDVMLELDPPKGLGFIVRTAGIDRTKRELSRDLAYLLRLWKVIVRRIKKHPGPIGIYEESDMIIRTIRDIFTAEVDTIYIDEPLAYERAKEFLQIVMPRYVNRLQLYEGREPLFHKYHLDREIALIHQRKVPLRQGGSIVIDQTEALVAIDVNSGSFRADDSAEETAYQMNLLAAREIARQLRLRDLGGVVVNGLHRYAKHVHRRGVERALRDAVKPRPCPYPRSLPHQPLRVDRNDAAAHSPQPEAQRLSRLPGMHRNWRGENSREHGDRSHAAVDPGHTATDRQGDDHRVGRRGQLSEQQETRRDRQAGTRQPNRRSSARAGTCFARTPRRRVSRQHRPRRQVASELSDNEMSCATTQENKKGGTGRYGLSPHLFDPTQCPLKRQRQAGRFLVGQFHHFDLADRDLAPRIVVLEGKVPFLPRSGRSPRCSNDSSSPLTITFIRVTGLPRQLSSSTTTSYVNQVSGRDQSACKRGTMAT